MVRVLFVLIVLALLPLTSPSPASNTPAAPRKKSRKAVTRPPPKLEVSEEEEEEEEMVPDEDDSRLEEEEDMEDSASAAAPPPPKRKASAKKKPKKSAVAKKRRAPPPPPPSMFSSLGAGWNRLADGAREQVDGLRATMAARAEAQQLEAARTRRAHAVRMRELREEMAELQAQAAADGEELEDGDDEAMGELTLSERGALLGSLLLSPAGVPGVVVGGAFGGAAGYVTDRLEQARAYISGAYHDRVETERRNVQQMQSAHDELKSLDEVRVRSADPEEAAELTDAMVEFLCRPCNKKCADCAAPFCAHNEAWASVNLGVLVCVNCAAVHRSMGVNVSRIKSVVFDRWDPTMARTLLAGGNDRARSLYLARLPRGYAEPTPDAEAERRGTFIRTKYVRLKWAQPELREARRAEIAQRRVRTATASVKRARPAAARTGAMPSLSSEHA